MIEVPHDEGGEEDGRDEHRADEEGGHEFLQVMVFNAPSHAALQCRAAALTVEPFRKSTRDALDDFSGSDGEGVMACCFIDVFILLTTKTTVDIVLQRITHDLLCGGGQGNSFGVSSHIRSSSGLGGGGWWVVPTTILDLDECLSGTERDDFLVGDSLDLRIHVVLGAGDDVLAFVGQCADRQVPAVGDSAQVGGGVLRQFVASSVEHVDDSGLTDGAVARLRGRVPPLVIRHPRGGVIEVVRRGSGVVASSRRVLEFLDDDLHELIPLGAPVGGRLWVEVITQAEFRVHADWRGRELVHHRLVPRVLLVDDIQSGLGLAHFVHDVARVGDADDDIGPVLGGACGVAADDAGVGRHRIHRPLAIVPRFGEEEFLVQVVADRPPVAQFSEDEDEPSAFKCAR